MVDGGRRSARLTVNPDQHVALSLLWVQDDCVGQVAQDQSGRARDNTIRWLPIWGDTKDAMAQVLSSFVLAACVVWAAVPASAQGGGTPQSGLNPLTQVERSQQTTREYNPAVPQGADAVDQNSRSSGDLGIVCRNRAHGVWPGRRSLEKCR